LPFPRAQITPGRLLLAPPPSKPQLLPEAHRTGQFFSPTGDVYPRARRSSSSAAVRSRRRQLDPEPPLSDFLLHQHHITLLKLIVPAIFQFPHRNVLPTSTPSFLRRRSSASSSSRSSSAFPPRPSTLAAPHHPHEASQALLVHSPALRSPERRHQVSKSHRRLCHRRSAATAPPPTNFGHPRDRRKPLSLSPPLALAADELSRRNFSPSICPREEKPARDLIALFQNFPGAFL
jgi:hypothetical protein